VDLCGKGQHGLLGSLRRELAFAHLEIAHGRFQRSMALITGFSAVVSGVEAYTQHQRGAFSHWLMWTPVWLTPPTAAASGAAFFNEGAAHKLLPAISLVSLADGVIGFIFHLRGIERMPGGFKLGQYNIVMGPPVFAPLLTCTVGVMGIFSSLLRREKAAPPGSGYTDMLADLASKLETRIEHRSLAEKIESRIEQGRFQRGMAVTAAFFAVLTGGEAYFEHMRGSYNQRVMWTPVWVTLLMAASGIGAAASDRVAHAVLPIASLLTFADGLLGFLLHLRGIRRMPGGFANLRFNITMGPPLFAPLLLTSVGLMGLIASLFRRARS
jgi:hypothetical protein